MEVDEGQGSGTGSSGSRSGSIEEESKQEKAPAKPNCNDSECLSAEALQNIAAGSDCMIDDPELLGTKKSLTAR